MWSFGSKRRHTVPIVYAGCVVVHGWKVKFRLWNGYCWWWKGYGKRCKWWWCCWWKCCKKERKITAKGVALLFENLQRSSKLKLNQVNKIKQKVNDIIYLKITSETVPNVEKQMKRFVKYCEEAEDLHNSIVEMPIPQDEFDKQTKMFDA